MSRVGKQPVMLPSGVIAEIKDNTVFIKGKKGELRNKYPVSVTVSKEEGMILVKPC
jgi:Ribosomal protein L6P/L9E